MDFGPFLLLASLEGLVMAAVLALTAAGLSLVFGVMRVVNVAHGEFFMLGAVAAWFITDALPGPAYMGFIAALIAAPFIVGGIAALADTLILKRLNYDPDATIVATIGLLYIFQQLALSFYGPDARPVAPPFDFRIQFPWFGYSGYKLAVIGASVVILLGLWAIMTRSRFGLVMRATQYDRETARAFGINVDRVYAGVFALGAALAAVAAVLIVPIQQAHYLMGGDPLLLSFIVVIIGGLGSVKGAVAGSLLYGMSIAFAPAYLPADYTYYSIILTFVVLAVVLAVRPFGLFGKAE